MAKKQIDLFGNKISPSKMKDAERNLANKLDGSLEKVLAFLKSINHTYPFVKSKGQNRLLEWAQTLNPSDYQEVKEIDKLLKIIYDVEKSKDYQYTEKVSGGNAKVLLIFTIGGLSPLYHNLTKQSSELKHYRAFFEMLVYFTEEVFERMQLLLDDITDQSGNTRMSARKLHRIMENLLIETYIDYDLNSEVEVSMTSYGLLRPFYEITKFYDIDPRF